MQLERRYWQDVLTRMPTLTAAARVADVDPSTIYLTLKRCGLSRDQIAPPVPPLNRHEIGLTREAFMLAGEREYWMRLVGRYHDGERIAAVAGIERSTIYKRFKACRVSTRFLRQMLKRKLSYGNSAWQSLAAA